MHIMRLYEGTKEMLSEVKNSGRKIYLLSNAQRIFTEYEMNALEITKYFDGICDVEGAKNAGLSTLYIHTDISPKGEKPEADFVLDHMDMKRITEILMS